MSRSLHATSLPRKRPIHTPPPWLTYSGGASASGDEGAAAADGDGEDGLKDGTTNGDVPACALSGAASAAASDGDLNAADVEASCVVALLPTAAFSSSRAA